MDEFDFRLKIESKNIRQCFFLFKFQFEILIILSLRSSEHLVTRATMII